MGKSVSGKDTRDSNIAIHPARPLGESLKASPSEESSPSCEETSHVMFAG